MVSHKSFSTFGAALFFCSLSSTSATANVLIVDVTGGGNFTAIQPAVDAAVTGDTILVKTGTYDWFGVGNKALSIVGDLGSNVHISGSVRVQSLAAGKTVVIENLKCAGLVTSDPLMAYGLYLAHNPGHVRIEDCVFDGVWGYHLNGSPGIFVTDCADVSLTRTTSHGGSGDQYNQGGCCNYASGAGVEVKASALTIYDSTLRGGNGIDSDVGLPNNGGNGGNGCACTFDATLFASGSSFLGGNGGHGGYNAACFNGSYGGDGGNGIYISTGSAILLDTIEHAGLVGQEGPGPCDHSGELGYPRVGTAFTDLPGTAKHMISPTPVRENATYQVTFSGVPGEMVALVVANNASHVMKIAWKGVWLAKAEHPLLSIPVGTIPASGTLTVPWSALDLGGFPSRILHMQPVFVDAQGNHTIGNPCCTVILNQAY